MLITNNDIQDKICTLLLMRYKIVSPIKSSKMIKDWLEKHPDSTHELLGEYLKNRLVSIQNDELIDLYEKRIMTLVNDLRCENGITIQDRRYRFSNYPLCFVGNEAVKWIENRYLLSKPEAIRLGQELINLKIIHHVTDEHDFKNEYLFYRFYIDE